MRTAYWVAMIVLGTASAMAHGRQEAAALPAAKAAPPANGTDLATIQQLACKDGLEHLVPGLYYYCVGARDLARGRNARGVSMLQIAAAWGSKAAQYTLGVAYFNGDVASRDRSLGLAWLGLAAERRNPAYVATLQSAWNKATAAERVRADQLWRSMLPKYGDAHAAVRAFRHYRYERARIVSGEPYGARWCISGLTSRSITSMAVDRHGGSLNEQTGCMGWSGAALTRALDAYSDSVLDGWQGHVIVGPLQQVPAPKPEQVPAASSSRH